MAASSSLLTVKTIAEIASLTKSKWTSGKTISMTSDRYITVCDQGDLWSNPSVSYIDLANPKGPQVLTVPYKRHRMDARIVYAVRSPNGKLCLMQNAANVIWITGAAGFDAGEDLVVNEGHWPAQFARWLDDGHVAIVPGKRIFHIDMHGKAITKLHMADRFMKDYTVTDYQLSPSKNWSFVATIQLEENRAFGFLEVFNIRAVSSGSIMGFAGAFISSSDQINSRPTVQEALIANTLPDMNCLLFQRVEFEYVEKETAGVKVSQKEPIRINYPIDENGIEKDLPIAVKVARDGSSLAFVVTKMGYVHLFDYRNMCHLGSKRVIGDSASGSTLVFAQSDGRLTIVDSEGEVLQIDALLEDIISVLFDKDSSDVAVTYALGLKNPLPNPVFMRVFMALLRNEKDFARFLPFFQLNAGHLSVQQALLVLSECFDRMDVKHQITVAHNQLVLALYEKVGWDSIITIYERDASGQKLFSLLSNVGPMKMSESAVCKFVKVALKTGQMRALTHFISNLRVPYPEAVFDCLFSETYSPAVINPLLEILSVRYKFLVRLLYYRLTNGLPVRFRPLLEQTPQEDARKQLLFIIKFLLDLTSAEDLVSLDKKYELGLTPKLLQTIHEEIIDDLVQDGTRTGSLRSFLEYLVQQGVRDPAVHTRLVKLYIEWKQYDKVYPFVRSSKLYDAIDVGRWCEERERDDCHIALTIYEERNLTEDCIRLSGKLGSYRRQLSYLMKSKSQRLWEEVLSPDNPSRLDLLTMMLELTESNENVIYDNFEEVSVLIQAIGQTDLISETQAFIRKLFGKKYSSEQMRFLQLWSVRSLLKSSRSEDNLEKFFGDQLYSYDPLLVGAALAEAGHLRLAKKMYIKGTCWKEAAQLAHQEIGAMKHSADPRQNQELLASAGSICLKTGELTTALQYFLDAKCFTHYQEVCSLVHSDDAFNDWDLLIPYLESAYPTAKDHCANVTLALAYGKTNRIQDLNKLLTTGAGGEQRTQHDANTCRICEDAPKNVTFAPCGHMATCEGCSTQLKDCPICRRPIELKIKTYNA